MNTQDNYDVEYIDGISPTAVPMWSTHEPHITPSKMQPSARKQALPSKVQKWWQHLAIAIVFGGPQAGGTHPQ